jgi:hypothetical protein
METRRDLGAAAFAIANVVVETARVPLAVVEHFPGVRTLTREGAAVRGRVRSRLEGVVADLLCAPEAERAIDRMVAGALPDQLARSLIEHRVVERVTAEVLATVDLDTAVDDLVVGIIDRALLRPELTSAIARTVASPEVQAALGGQRQSPESGDAVRSAAAYVRGTMSPEFGDLTSKELS